MREGKLFVLLKNLSPQEFKEFKKVVHSPIYNTNPRMHQLYGLLKEKYPNFIYSEAEKERLFQVVFPNEPFNNYKIHRLFTQMTQVLEEYLLLLNQRNRPLERKKKLVQIYNERGADAFFQSSAKQWKKELEACSYHNMEYYAHAVELYEQLYFHSSYEKYSLDDSYLDLLLDSLDRYFILGKMRYGISLKSRERILAKPGKWRFLETIQQELEQDEMANDYLLRLYHLAFTLLDNETAADFKQFEHLLFTHVSQLQQDAKVLFFSGLNYINRQVNKGIAHFSRTAFDWYQFGLEQKLVFDHGQLTEVTFGNIVVYGCREKEFEWTKIFMDENAPLLKAEHRAEILTYHIGIWHFYQQNFTQAYTLLMNYNFPDAYFLKSRLLAIRAIFENFLRQDHYFDLLMHQINAFRQGIKRNKFFTKNAMEPILNTLDIIQLFAKKRQAFESKKILKDRLINEIEQKKKLTGKEWLIEKINAL